jgi:hypothetical protein
MMNPFYCVIFIASFASGQTRINETVRESTSLSNDNTVVRISIEGPDGPARLGLCTSFQKEVPSCRENYLLTASMDKDGQVIGSMNNKLIFAPNNPAKLFVHKADIDCINFLDDETVLVGGGYTTTKNPAGMILGLRRKDGGKKTSQTPAFPLPPGKKTCSDFDSVDGFFAYLRDEREPERVVKFFEHKSGTVKIDRNTIQ